MAKTTFLHDYSRLIFGYAVDTVVGASDYVWSNEDPPAVIGVKVFPPSMDGIGFSVRLAIDGVGEVAVTGTGHDGSGTEEDPYRSFFTYSAPLTLPATGASIRTPWDATGALLVTRANNSVTLGYYVPTEHDLYFRTQKTSDSGSIQVTVDGSSAGDISLSNPSTILESVLLKAKLSSGYHTVSVAAQITDPAVFVYFHSFEVLEHDT